MKKITVSILSVLMMLSMVFSSSVFAANEEVSAWDSFLGLFNVNTAAATDVGVEYRGHIENKGDFPLNGSWIQGPNELGTRGESLRMEGFWIRMTAATKPASMTIKYNVHVENEGWLYPENDSTTWPADGKFAGTVAKGQRIEAVKIVLVDAAGKLSTDYDVMYQGHVQNVGDLPANGTWYQNGEKLGTTGSGLRLEALKVKIVQKVADLTAYNAAKAKVTQADYTAASWTTYQAVVTANPAATTDLQSKVDAATAAITAAQANLVKVLKVESVSANNLKEVVVTFNGKVDPATAKTASNYTVSGNSFTATLGADGKTVTLFATNTFTNNAEKTIVIKGVKDEALAQTIVDTTVKFTPSDVIIPTVEKVEALSNKTFRVTFSEPINTVPVNTSYRIGGAGTGGIYGAFTPAAVTSTNSKVFTVTTATPVPEGAIDVEVNIAGTINDFAGYVVPTVKKTVTVTTDTTAPQAISATVLSQTEVQVTFNKEVTEAAVTAAQANFGWGTTSSTITKNAATATKIDATNYKVTFTGANAMTVGERFFFVPTAITDLGGNVVAAKSFPVTVVADAAPSVTNVTVPSANVIQINFNKSMDQTSVQAKANYVLKDSLGSTVSLTAASLSYDATNKLVLLTGLALTDSSYTLTMTNIKDNVLNTMTATTKTFTNVPSAGPTRVNSARFLDEADGTGKDVLILPFDMSMATSGTYSSLNAAKWTLNGAALPTVATLNINPSDDKEVVIHLNGNYTAGQNLTVNNIASAYGAIQTTVQTFTGPASAQAALDLSTGSTSIKLLDTKTFELKVNRKVSSVDPSEFAILQGGATDITTTATTVNAINPVASATYANTTTGSTITITMTNALNTTVNYQVGTKASVIGTKDLDGLAFAASKTYATNATIAIAANITGAYVLDNTHVVVKLDQPVGMTSKADFVVKYDGVTQAITSATGNANTISLLVPAGASTAGTVTLATVGQATIQTESVSGLKITALADVKTADMFRVQAVALGNSDGTLAVDDTVTVTFTQAVDPLTLGFVAGDKQGDDTYTKTVLNSIHTTAGTAATTDAELILRNVGASADLVTLNIANLAGGTYFSASVANIDSQITLSADGKTLTYKITGQAGGAVTTTTAAARYGNVQSITVDTATIGSTTQNIINTFMTNVLTSTKF